MSPFWGWLETRSGMEARRESNDEALKEAWNAALEYAADSCSEVDMFNEDDPGETYARVVRELQVP